MLPEMTEKDKESPSQIADEPNSNNQGSLANQHQQQNKDNYQVKKKTNIGFQYANVNIIIIIGFSLS